MYICGNNFDMGKKRDEALLDAMVKVVQAVTDLRTLIETKVFIAEAQKVVDSSPDFTWRPEDEPRYCSPGSCPMSHLYMTGPTKCSKCGRTVVPNNVTCTANTGL